MTLNQAALDALEHFQDWLGIASRVIQEEYTDYAEDPAYDSLLELLSDTSLTVDDLRRCTDKGSLEWIAQLNAAVMVISKARRLWGSHPLVKGVESFESVLVLPMVGHVDRLVSRRLSKISHVGEQLSIDPTSPPLLDPKVACGHCSQLIAETLPHLGEVRCVGHREGQHLEGQGYALQKDAIITLIELLERAKLLYFGVGNSEVFNDRMAQLSESDIGEDL